MLDLRQYIAGELKTFELFRNAFTLLNKFLEIFVSELIAIFKSAVIRAILLNCIICQMHKFVF